MRLDIAFEDRKTFAKGFCVYKFIWIFCIICIFGYIYESILCIFQLGHFESRQGLIYGPFIPVYGCGAMIYMFIIKYEKSLFKIFIYTSFIGGAFEFLYSFFQEKLLGTVSWNYDSYFMNFQGRTSIIHAVFWGILGMVFAKFVYPYLSNRIEKIPLKIGIALSWVGIIFMIFNIYLSIVASARQKQRLYNMPPKNYTEFFLDRYFPNDKLDNKYTNHKRIHT
ncbi:MAG: putative ABC transporter permease [Clostridia bacterium]